MLATFRQQGSARLVGQALQHVQLLVESFGSAADAGIDDLAYPLGSMTGILDVPVTPRQSRTGLPWRDRCARASTTALCKSAFVMSRIISACDVGSLLAAAVLHRNSLVRPPLCILLLKRPAPVSLPHLVHFQLLIKLPLQFPLLQCDKAALVTQCIEDRYEAVFGVSIVVDRDLSGFHTLDLLWRSVRIRWITVHIAQFVRYQVKD